jgi:hypothetical protein
MVVDIKVSSLKRFPSIFITDSLST